MASDAAPHSTASIWKTVGVRACQPFRPLLSCSRAALETTLEPKRRLEDRDDEADGTLLVHGDAAVRQHARGHGLLSAFLRRPAKAAARVGALEVHLDEIGCALRHQVLRQLLVMKQA